MFSCHKGLLGATLSKYYRIELTYLSIRKV